MAETGFLSGSEVKLALKQMDFQGIYHTHAGRGASGQVKQIPHCGITPKQITVSSVDVSIRRSLQKHLSSLTFMTSDYRCRPVRFIWTSEVYCGLFGKRLIFNPGLPGHLKIVSELHIKLLQLNLVEQLWQPLGVFLLCHLL